jgi:predicted acylesterase/phospholipase RssA
LHSTKYPTRSPALRLTRDRSNLLSVIPETAFANIDFAIIHIYYIIIAPIIYFISTNFVYILIGGFSIMTESEKPFFILSCDGGGIRGIATISFLYHMEQHLQTIDPEFSIYSAFDMFAGTSIGAFIVMLIALKKKSMQEIKDYFVKDMYSQIMDKSMWDKLVGIAQHKPKYDGKGKTCILSESFGDMSFSDTEKHVLVPTYNITKRFTKVFYSHECDKTVLAREVVDASSAAPAYFPASPITISGKTEWYIDGGMTVNNPSICAVSRAYNMILSTTKRKIVMINVGTGIKNKCIIGEKAKDYGGIEWLLNDIIGIAMDESVVHEQTKMLLQNHTYLNVTSELIGISDSMDECSDNNVARLHELGLSWWNTYKDEIIAIFTKSSD